MVSTSHQNFKRQNIRPFQSKEHHIYFRGNFPEEITNQSCQTTTNRSGIPKEIKEFLGKYHPRIPTLQHTLERPSQFCIMKEWLKTPLRRFSSSPVMYFFTSPLPLPDISSCPVIEASLSGKSKLPYNGTEENLLTSEYLILKCLLPLLTLSNKGKNTDDFLKY